MKNLTRNLIAILIIGLGMVHRAQALHVSPSYQFLQVKPGEKVKSKFLVTNNDTSTQTITVSSKDWFILDDNKKISVDQWILFNKNKSITLKPGQSKEVEFSVKAPKEAVGELVGMLSFAVVPNEHSMVNQVMSVAVYGAIEGTENFKAELAGIMLSPSTGTLRVGVSVENKGNVHVRPTGIVKILDSTGKIYANIILEQGRPAYPGRKESYYGNASGVVLSSGSYVVNVALTDVDRQFGIADLNKEFTLNGENKVELK